MNSIRGMSDEDTIMEDSNDHYNDKTMNLENDENRHELEESDQLKRSAIVEALDDTNKQNDIKENYSKEHLIISSIVIENFKSYGGKHTIGPFHQRFSSIVGPNGSGKSNIIDAMLFVFGRRAQQLRHKKLADLIHHSASLFNLQSASVSVHFQNIVDDSTSETGWQLVPNSSLTICREAFVDGSSRYTIDGRVAIQKDVVALLKSRGVDLDHNRFLILQGEVEQIAMMKPKAGNPNEEGLLEYLEDIIGSNLFIPQINCTKEELEKVAELVQERREKMQSAKTQVESMKGPLQLAEQVCETERKLLTLKTQLELRSQRNACRELEKAQSRYDEIKIQWTEWKANRSNDKNAIAELEAAVKKQKEVVLKAEKLLGQLEQAFSDLERRDNELTASQAHCTKRSQALQKEAAKLEAEKAKCETLSIELKQKAEVLKQQVPQLQSRVESLTSELEILEKSLQHEFDLIRKLKEKADQELQPEVIRLGKMKETVEVMKTKARLIDEKQQVARQDQQSIQSKLKTSQDQLNERKTHFNEKQKTMEKMRKAFTKKHAEMIALRDEYTKQRDKTQQLRQQLEMKETQLNESKTETLLIRRILDARNDGTLHGVVDRLWNLGSIDESLEVAFSAIANSEVIVVENTTDAQSVVEFVRDHHLGRVTCIVLDRVRAELSIELNTLRKKKLPEGSKLLLNLVNIENPDHEIAFYFLLRDALLVTTLDEAQRVAFGGAQRWRVVTMEGQLIDRSGIMSGGMNLNQHNGGKTIFKQSIRGSGTEGGAIEIEKLKIAIAEKEGHLNALREKKVRAETDVTELDKNMNEIDQERVKLTAEVESTKQDVEHYLKHLASLEIPELTEKEKRELIQLGREYEKLEVEILSQQEIVNTKQEEVDRITASIEAVGGERRKKLKSDLETISTELEKLQKELKDADIQSEVNRKRAEKLETVIPEKYAEAEGELEASRNHEKSKDQITDEAEDVMRRKEEIEHVLNEQRLIEKEKSKILKERTDESKKFGLREVEFQTSFQDLEQTLANCKAVVKKHQKQLTKYEDQFNLIPYVGDLSVVSDDNHYQEQSSVNEERPLLKLEMTEDELEKVDKVFVECEIKKLTESMASVKVDLSILEKYRVAATRLKERVAEFEEVCQLRETKARELEHLEYTRLKEFSAGFVVIAAGVKELYQMITQDGDAELELADPSNPFSGGIIFSVRPPKKSWKRIQNLSGGEKTLSSLSLVFALHQFRPTPIYFLDEIDAALDHRNVSTIALYIANQAKGAQFVIISLRNHMFELADRLVGIYKTHGITKTAIIDPDDFVSDQEKGAIRELECFEHRESIDIQRSSLSAFDPITSLMPSLHA